MRSLRANNNNKSLNIFLTDDLAENYFRSVLEKRKKKTINVRTETSRFNRIQIWVQYNICPNTQRDSTSDFKAQSVRGIILPMYYGYVHNIPYGITNYYYSEIDVSAIRKYMYTYYTRYETSA